jgi:hypothetical protein
MYALIYDEHDQSKPLKEVLSVHPDRKSAEIALEKRLRRLEKRIWDCHTRIVWIGTSVKQGEFIREKNFSAWRPGEPIPWGEIYSDSD